MTGLQFAIILGHDDIAKDIIDATLKDDLDGYLCLNYLFFLLFFFFFFKKKKK